MHKLADNYLKVLILKDKSSTRAGNKSFCNVIILTISEGLPILHQS